jgi:hypothetical protein
LTAHAQQPTQPARVGLLTFGQGLASPLFGAFRDEMRNLGHVEGRSYVLEFRLARGDPDGLHSAAGEPAQIPVDVIVTDRACFLSEREADLNAEFGRTGHGS